MGKPPLNNNKTISQENDVLDKISPRELEVLKLLLAGESNKSVALILGISPRTVEVHRANMMRRLDVSSFAELVRVALTAGIEPEQQSSRPA